MSKIKPLRVTHPVFGNCLKLENGLTELLVTLDFGPRIIHFSICGKDNMFYEDLEKKTIGKKFDVYGGDQLRLYGGHRLWISPEIMPRCYHPDNGSVHYKETEDGSEFTAPVEKMNGIEKSMIVMMSEDEPAVTVHHVIKNCGQWDLELAPWALTMLAKGGKAVIPMPKSQTGFLPNRNISLWDYSRMDDERVHWGHDYIVLTQNETPAAFKLGLNNEAGWAAYFNREQLFIKFFEPDINGLYPDNGCCYETYTSDAFLESESLGQITLLEPGSFATHTEGWELYDEASLSYGKKIDENEIRRRLEPYII